MLRRKTDDRPINKSMNLNPHVPSDEQRNKRQPLLIGGLRWAPAYHTDTKVGAGQAAAVLKVPVATLKAWMRTGKVPVYESDSGQDVLSMKHVSDLSMLLARVRHANSGVSPTQGQHLVDNATPAALWGAVLAVAEQVGATSYDPAHRIRR